MSVSRYMSYCLGHPTLGYYARMRNHAASTVLGKQGDFITSPEISQVFGEVSCTSLLPLSLRSIAFKLIAIWFIAQWQAQGSPKHTRMIEIGPGKGTLMSDMLRVSFLSFAVLHDFDRSWLDIPPNQAFWGNAQVNTLGRDFAVLPIRTEEAARRASQRH